MATSKPSQIRLIDIGANLTDTMFQGSYHGKAIHPADLEAVLMRSYEIGVEKVIVTSGSLSDCQQALELVRTDAHLFTTVGVHPTRCGEFEAPEVRSAQDHLDQLLRLVEDNREKVVAIGECGLDYDRLHFCPQELQKKYFEPQLALAERTGLPLFLHCRNSSNDMIDILTRNKSKLVGGGVVHSFTGTLEEAKEFLSLGLFIGVNGCSLKTEENLEVVRRIPAERILLETDAPWCEIRPTHASSKLVETKFACKKKERWEPGSSVKSRNEPRNIVQVLEVVAALLEREKQDLAEQIYQNTCRLFPFPS